MVLMGREVSGIQFNAFPKPSSGPPRQRKLARHPASCMTDGPPFQALVSLGPTGTLHDVP